MNSPFSQDKLEKLLALSQSYGDEIRKYETLLDHYFGSKDRWSPREGQVWRIKSKEIIMLVLILKIKGSYALVCPVTIEPAVEDENCIISLSETGLTPCPLIIWLSMMRVINTSLFDKPIDDFGIKLIEDLREKEYPPFGFRSGRPIASVYSDDAAFRAEIEDDINSLARYQFLGRLLVRLLF